MTVPVTRSQVLRVIRGVGSFLKELLGELAGEAVLTVIACLAVAGPALASSGDGSAARSSPAVRVASCWPSSATAAGSCFAPGRPGRRGRPAGAAAAMFAGAALFVACAWSCDCS